MAGKINNNSQADFSRRLLGINQREQEDTLKRIASGLRIRTASDDAAGLAISERLKALSSGFEQAQANLQDGASALQVAEGGISQISGSVQRIRELAVQASNDTLSDEDRALIQKEVDQLVEEIDRQAEATSFNGKPLLDGSVDGSTDSFTVQSGAAEGETIDANIGEVSAASLGLAGIDLSTRDSASAALSTLDTALSAISGEQANIGSTINRINSANDFVGVARENTLSALSTIRDADLAAESTKLAIQQLRSQSNLSALAQSNLNPQNALALLG